MTDILPQRPLPVAPSSPFSVVNGITVFDNGEVRKWLDPSCKWWREWHEDKCPVCGTKRDGETECRQK